LLRQLLAAIVGSNLQNELFSQIVASNCRLSLGLKPKIVAEGGQIVRRRQFKNSAMFLVYDFTKYNDNGQVVSENYKQATI